MRLSLHRLGPQMKMDEEAMHGSSISLNSEIKEESSKVDDGLNQCRLVDQ